MTTRFAEETVEGHSFPCPFIAEAAHHPRTKGVDAPRWGDTPRPVRSGLAHATGIACSGSQIMDAKDRTGLPENYRGCLLNSSHRETRRDAIYRVRSSSGMWRKIHGFSRRFPHRIASRCHRQTRRVLGWSHVPLNAVSGILSSVVPQFGGSWFSVLGSRSPSRLFWKLPTASNFLSD
jgi:hypothetical protein